jgi:hypothetical protein
MKSPVKFSVRDSSSLGRLHLPNIGDGIDAVVGQMIKPFIQSRFLLLGVCSGKRSALQILGQQNQPQSPLLADSQHFPPNRERFTLNLQLALSADDCESETQAPPRQTTYWRGFRSILQTLIGV